MAGFAFAAWGWFNEFWVQGRWPELYVDSPLVSRYSEVLVIAAFGLWRVKVERNRPTRRRVAVLVTLVALLWGVVPWLWPFVEPAVGTLPWPPGFPGVHVPGALTWFVWLGLIFLFGRRVDCSWCCPCVGIRETAGAPFRDRTLKGPLAWAMRHAKWPFLAAHVAYVVLLFVPGELATTYFTLFWTWVPASYYASFFLVPWTGNRNYCRYLCPWGVTYGVVSTLGFFRIEAEVDRCRSCGLCEQVCDMGVPVVDLIHEHGEVRVPDCVGCGRCADACPADVLHLRDVRDGLRLPGLAGGSGGASCAAGGSCGLPAAQPGSQPMKAVISSAGRVAAGAVSDSKPTSSRRR